MGSHDPIDDDPTALERPGFAELAETMADEREPVHDDPLHAAGDRIAHYVVEDVIGAGGMGVVYSARDEKLGRKVAIKVLRGGGSSVDDRLRVRLEREAQAMAKLSHPNVITVYEAGAADREIYIAMELVRGTTLRRWLKHPRGWRDVVRTFVGAGRGLEAAHAVGLVHRDFKPDNVLIDTHGRVRVTDFGLARQHAEPEPRRARTRRQRIKNVDLTTTGELLGTPQYMSPEQCKGEPAGPPSDQFSFCLALYEALYRHHPFASESLAELLLKVSSGNRAPPPRRVRLPRWLRAVVERGLRVNPEDRFPSMTALLGELERRRLDWRPFAAGGVVVVATAGVIAWRIDTRDERAVADGCAMAGAELAQLWSPVRKAEIEHAFAATKIQFAGQAWKTVSAQLDAHASQLASLEQRACRARDPLREERAICVTERKRVFAGLLELFAHADRVVVEHAVDAAQTLDLRACTDHRALVPSAPLPATAKAKVEQARGLISRAELDMSSGRFDQGMKLARSAIVAARASGYSPVLAASLTVGGRLQWYSGRMDDARMLFREAVTSSEVGNDDRARAQALTWLVQVVGTELADYSAGTELGDMARAALVRAGGDDNLEALLEFHLGMMALKRGDPEQGLAHQRKALKIRLVTLGKDHGDVGHTRLQIGSCLHALGKLDAALAEEQQALQIITERYGASHPLAANALNEIGNVLVAKGELAHAIETYQKAIARLEASVGRVHPDVAIALSNLGAAMLSPADVPHAAVVEAVRHLREALSIEEKLFVRDHKEIAETLRNLGRAQLRLPDGKAAVAAFERALEIFSKHPEYGEELAEVRFDLAKAYLADGRRDDARISARMAAEAYEIAGRAVEAQEIRDWLP